MPLMHRSLTILSSSSCQRIQRILFQTWWIICLQRGIQFIPQNFDEVLPAISRTHKQRNKHPTMSLPLQRPKKCLMVSREAIKNELVKLDIRTFASLLDKDYENEMMECVGYTYACTEFLHISRVTSCLSSVD